MRARGLSDLGFARTRAITALTNRRGRDAPRPPNNGDAIARSGGTLRHAPPLAQRTRRRPVPDRLTLRLGCVPANAHDGRMA
jgi:hypothetical protein